MRHFYVEHDLVSAEVQAFFQDGSMSLHTRSLMYGKLEGGMLVKVMPTLIKRLKQHFHTFSFGVHAIFGMNGFIWVSATQPGTRLAEGAEVSAEAPPEPPTHEERERVCRVRNALVALDRLCIAVSPASVSDVYNASLAAGLAPKHMLLPKHMVALCQNAMGAHGDVPSAEPMPMAPDVM